MWRYFLRSRINSGSHRLDSNPGPHTGLAFGETRNWRPSEFSEIPTDRITEAPSEREDLDVIDSGQDLKERVGLKFIAPNQANTEDVNIGGIIFRFENGVHRIIEVIDVNCNSIDTWDNLNGDRHNVAAGGSINIQFGDDVNETYNLELKEAEVDIEIELHKN